MTHVENHIDLLLAAQSQHFTETGWRKKSNISNNMGPVLRDECCAGGGVWPHQQSFEVSTVCSNLCCVGTALALPLNDASLYSCCWPIFRATFYVFFTMIRNGGNGTIRFDRTPSLFWINRNVIINISHMTDNGAFVYFRLDVRQIAYQEPENMADTSNPSVAALDISWQGFAVADFKKFVAYDYQPKRITLRHKWAPKTKDVQRC